MASPIKRQLFRQYASPRRNYSQSLPEEVVGFRTRISTAPSGFRFGSGMTGDTFNYQASGFIGSEKLTLQLLNERLASYMNNIASLEKKNRKLEIKIHEVKEKWGTQEGRDDSKYKAVIADLKGKIMDMIKSKAGLSLSLDHELLNADDFRVKLENEQSMRQTAEADVAHLRRLLDNTKVIHLQLESEVEGLKEERILLDKDHETDAANLRAQINQGSVRVDVDAPKGQDLARIMEEMRDKYEKITLKNEEELKTWHDSQIKVVKVQVTESSTALKEANTELSKKKRKQPALEIALQSALSLNESVEANLRDVEMRNNMDLAECNAIILGLEENLSQIRAEIQHKSKEYEWLETEITEYRRLLDRDDLKPEDAVDLKKVQTKVVTLIQTLVDGKVVSESKDVQEQEDVVMN